MYKMSDVCLVYSVALIDKYSIFLQYDKHLHAI